MHIRLHKNARTTPTMRDASAMPAVQERLKQNGIIPSTFTVEQFVMFSNAENVRWLAVMKRANIQAN